MTRTLFAAAFALLVCSCGPTETRVPCHPVRGQLFYKGKPAAGAQVILSPVDDALAKSLPMKPNGTVGDDGSFTISTYADEDGAPAGEYKLLFVWERPNPDNEEETIPILPADYAEPARSRHPVQIKPEPNEIPRIDLK